jgi:hypothetical protein
MSNPLARTLLALVFAARWSAIGAVADRTYSLPCEPGSFAPSGDGTMVWISCFDIDKARATADPTNNWTRPSRLFALDLASGQLTELRRAIGWFQIAAAPTGDRAVIVVPDENGERRFLYQRSRELSLLPPVISFAAWSADGQAIYFFDEGASTDTTDTLGILPLDNRAARKTKLAVPTEEVSVCAKDGHVFAGTVPFSRSGHPLPYAAAEYDAELRFVGRNARISPGSFSAGCKYVASPGSFPHGPAPWRIVETATGRQLLQVEFNGEGKGEDAEFLSWNPRRDNLLLRLYFRAPAGNDATDLQVFDILKRRVVDSVAGSSGDAAWSRDGEFLMFLRGQSLVAHRIPSER